MSKSLPIVSITTVPARPTENEYQIDAEAPYPPWFGSPDSRVAERVELVARTEVPVGQPSPQTIGVAPLNASLASGANGVTAAEATDGKPVPAELVALTRNTCATRR